MVARRHGRDGDQSVQFRPMASRGADVAVRPPTDVTDATAPLPVRAYFPCFEGLRALAAGAVVVFHAVSVAGPAAAGPLHTPASVLDMGVSVFFVISGFLLYRPFVAAGAEQRPVQGPLRFWWRRILRIVPAYWLAFTVLWALGWITVDDQPWRYYLFLQIYDAYTFIDGVVPAWSLNTEITFYLLVPVWAFFVRRVLGRGRPTLRLEAAGAVALVVLGYAARVIVSGIDRVWATTGDGRPVRMRELTFAWLPTTVDLFAFGMLLAVLSVAASRNPGLRARLDRLARPAGLWWAAAAAGWLAFAYGPGAPNPTGGYDLAYGQVRQATFAFVAVTLLVPAVFGDQEHGILRAIVSSRPVVWLGAVSYGLYLWHFPLLQRIPVWLDRPGAEVPLVALLAGAFGLGLGAAAVSWYALERPLQTLRRDRPALSVVPPGLDRRAAAPVERASR